MAIEALEPSTPRAGSQCLNILFADVNRCLGFRGLGFRGLGFRVWGLRCPPLPCSWQARVLHAEAIHQARSCAGLTAYAPGSRRQRTLLAPDTLVPTTLEPGLTLNPGRLMNWHIPTEEP